MLFNYKALTPEGEEKQGSIDSSSRDAAIQLLQQRRLTVVSIHSTKKKSFLDIRIDIFDKIALKDIVIVSRQMATLFKAHVSALRIFRMLSAQSEKPALQKVLVRVADDIQGGASISDALEKHPKVFSSFYVNMVRSGEETGKLSDVFESLASLLDRSYELSVKTKNALIYPAFVISTFGVVMILMLTLVFPNLSSILVESGQEIPIYTRIVMGVSTFLIDYGPFLLILLAIGGIGIFRYIKTTEGSIFLSRVQFQIPVLGKLLKMLYLSRIADNMDTLLGSGITLTRALEVTSTIVGNAIYADIINKSNELVKGGVPLSEAFSRYEEIPVVMVQIIKVGEETGELGNILKTLAMFYKREVDTTVDTLVGLIEPMLIVLLGLGVGFILTSVLVPIYNVSSGF